MYIYTYIYVYVYSRKIKFAKVSPLPNLLYKKTVALTFEKHYQVDWVAAFCSVLQCVAADFWEILPATPS